MRPLLLVLLALACGGAGCTYTVRVRNDNGHAVTARLIQSDPLMKDWTLAERRINPGETAQLGPARTMRPYILLEADPTHGEGLGVVRRRITPGDQAFRIGTEQLDDHTAILLKTAGWSELEP